MKIREVAYDILNNIKQLSDDSNITLYHVVYWMMAYGDRLKAQHIIKRDSGAFLHTFNSVQVLKETDTGRKYFTLPTGIYDYDLDDGIDYISYSYHIDPCKPAFTSITFYRTSPSKAAILFYTDDEKPAPSNPYFYRVGENVFLLGVERININFVEVGLLSTFDPRTVVELDDEFDFPNELLPILQRQILDLGRFVLMIPQERINDASASLDQQLPTQKLISVNDAINPQIQAQQQQAYSAEQGGVA